MATKNPARGSATCVRAPASWGTAGRGYGASHGLRADETENVDLYWALRGGGGNFGVVTSLEYRLHSLGEVYGGALMHPLERAPEVFAFLRDFTAQAPDELTVMAAVISSPEGQPLSALAAYRAARAAPPD